MKPNYESKGGAPMTDAEFEKIKSLDLLDLRMLVAEINDNGWPIARATLVLMPPAGPESEYKARMKEAQQ